MTEYTINLLTPSGSIVAAHEITCDDDKSAIARARELFGQQAFNMWRGDRCIYPIVPTTGS